MEKLYHVVITELDPETKAEKEIHIDEFYKNVTLLADCTSRDTMAEVILNDNVIEIAAKLACGEKVREASLIASAMMKIMEDTAGKAGDSLMREFMRR